MFSFRSGATWGKVIWLPQSKGLCPFLRSQERTQQLSQPHILCPKLRLEAWGNLHPFFFQARVVVRPVGGWAIWVHFTGKCPQLVPPCSWSGN